MPFVFLRLKVPLSISAFNVFLLDEVLKLVFKFSATDVDVVADVVSNLLPLFIIVDPNDGDLWIRGEEEVFASLNFV